MKHTVTEHQLASGAKGLLIDVPGSRVVNILVRFNSGFQFGDLKLFEMPHVMEHMIGRGTKKYPNPNEFKAEIEKNGGYSNANTSARYNGYIFDCAEFELERIMGLLEQLITEPIFPEAAFGTEISNVREELVGCTTNHGQVCSTALGERTFPHLMLNYDDRIRQLPGITRDMVINHYHRTHTARNARFYLAGAVGEQKQMLLDRLEKLFAKLPEGERLQPDLRPGIGMTAPIVTERDIKKLYYRCDLYAGPIDAYHDLDMALGTLGSVLFGGWNARVFGEARRRGLAYNVSGGGSADAASSAFSFGGSVTPDNAPELMKLVAHELKDVKEGGLEPAELEVAKDRVIGRRELAHQTPGSLLNYYLGDYDLEEVVRPYDEEIEQIRAVTVEDVIRAARHVFSSGQWGISWLGDLDEAKAAEYTEPIAKLFS